MTDHPAPLSLPASDWEDWLAARCDGRLAAVRRLAATIADASESRDSEQTLGLWVELGLALREALAVTSLLSNVHPDADVRSRAEQGEQDAARLETAIGQDRALYEVLAALDTEDFARIHRRSLATLPGVRGMQSSFALRTVRQTTALPV